MAQPEDRPARNVKILSVVWFKVFPPRFGGQKAVALFNEQLAEFAPLICLCSRDNEPAKAPYRTDNTLPAGKKQVLNPLVWRRIYRTAKKEAVSHVLLEFPYYGIAGLLCQRFLGLKLAVNTHNIEYLRFKEQKKWWWGLLYHLERIVLKKADAVFFKTADDLRTAQKRFGLAGSRLAVIPYGCTGGSGADKTESQVLIRNRHGIHEDETILLFAGTLDYSPNAEAVGHLVKNLIPLLKLRLSNFRVLVCGRNRSAKFEYLNQLQSEHFLMVGEVDEIERYYEAADVFVNPVLTGGGIQTKNVDALCCHLNLVCFASRQAGIEGAGNKIFSVPDGDWEGFADAVQRATQSNDPAPAEFFDRHNWRTIAAKAFRKITAG